MSSQETVTGEIIKLVPFENENLEEQSKRILNCELNTRWYNTFLDQLLSTEDYILIGTNIYKIDVKYNIDYNDYCLLEKTGENKYLFITSFYNGGTCLQEMLEEKLRKHENL